MSKRGCVVAAAAWLTGVGAADIINVPGDYATIQAAIDAAVDGDVVLVADGVYTGPGNRDIDFGGRVITVRSATGPDLCIVDVALDDHRGFYFHSGETRDAILDGFTIRRARKFAASGGGILCAGSSPTLVNCIIEDNQVLGFSGYGGLGGGVLSVGSPAIINCTIRNNEAHGADGAAPRGAGIVSSGAGTLISGCTFVGNQCPLVGSPFAHPSDGGLRVSGAGTLVANCTFIANAAEVGGGAGVLGGAALVNCTFSGNHAVYIAGAYVATGAALISCTFTQNVADDEHGGVSASDANVHNCIFWGNAPDQFNGTAATMLTHSDIQGGWSGRGWNNIDADPLFVDSDGLDGQPGTADDDLRLEAGSPCVDAGINSGMPTDAADLDGDGEMSELTPYDLDSNPRFADGPPKDTGCGVPVVVDMGAYEFQGKPFDVRLGDIDGNGNVGFTDFLALLDAWGACAEDCCLPDLDLDSEVGVTDFLLLLGNWG